MRGWLRRHRVFATVLWTFVALAATEGALLLYYLNSWLTMPVL
jgi:cytochrome bd-type quinol oxidase subunit 1